MSTVSELLAAALQEQQAGNLANAENFCRQALHQDSASPEAYRRLASIYHAQSRWAEAEEFYLDALRLRPDFGEASNELGIVYALQGKVGPAIDLFQTAMRTMPGSADAHNNLGIMFARAQRFDEAAASFRKALEVRPDFVEAHFNLANAFREQGNFAGAVIHFQHAVELRPNYAEGYNNLGLALREEGRVDEAILAMQRSVQCRPNYGKAHHNLGLALQDKGYLDAAIASYRRALQLIPDSVETLLSLGGALRETKKIDEALTVLAEAQRLKPDSADAYNSLGNTLMEYDQFAEAETAFREAIRLPDPPNNLANLLGRIGRHTEALAEYAEAIRLRPDFAEAHTNRSFIWLLLGNYAQGWQEYEWRWRCKKTPSVSSFDRPVWDGSDLAGRTILLQEEQGLGDTIQFIRYAQLVKARGGRVLVHCQAALIPLLAGCPGIDGIVDKNSAPPPFDVRVPLMSLPRLFGTELASIPGGVPYLAVNADHAAGWQDQLAAVRGFRIGITWQGNPMHPGDRFRSVPLLRFAGLAALPGVALVSLQQGTGTEQVATLGGAFPLTVLQEPAGGERTLVDTAAIMKGLDLVITVDTAIAHLGGALGVPTWVPISFAPDWRWLLDRADSPWYPTIRLFRQEDFGQWAPVFERMADEVRALVPISARAEADVNNQLQDLDRQIEAAEKTLELLRARRRTLANRRGAET
jgi:tetratricopeptide (TPR) repeat protein